jgi:hypothetical protein
MPRITISYRHDDSLDITGRIFDRLAGHFGREAVFRDIDNIPPGADFRRHIDRVIEESDIVLAVVGPRWIGPDDEHRRLASPADPVRFEIETALRKNKPLIPVLVAHAVMPPPDALPDSLHDFAYRNAVRVDGGQDFDVHVGRLIRGMERILQVDEDPVPDSAAQGVIAAITVAAPELVPKAEPRVGPVVTSVCRRVWHLFAWTGLAVMMVAIFFSWSVWVRWAIGLGVVVIVMATLFSGGGFWRDARLAKVGNSSHRDAQVGLGNDRNEA